MDIQAVLQFQVLNASGIDYIPTFHILSGSFRSLSLFLLAFTPSQRSISHLSTIPAHGPHQYLAADQRRTRIYTTSWALPPSLSSWEVERSNPLRINHVNTVPITATSSYISVPPPFHHTYSVGGPTGEVHLIDPVTGGLGQKVQEILFIPKDELENADKTRRALRYGSHGIEFTPSNRFAFVPVLGTHIIEMYSRDNNGHLTHVSSTKSPRGDNSNDGPRHVKIHPNGKVLYCITEHSNFVDAYEILPTTLKHVTSLSLLPGNMSSSQVSIHHFRGDTLMLSPSAAGSPNPQVLVTTTRGSDPELRGWLSIFPLDENGQFSKSRNEIDRYQTPTSGGKANAIDLLSKDSSGVGLWILITDDDDHTVSSGTGAIRVLEWDGWETGGVKEVAEWPSGAGEMYSGPEPRIQGASHAIWLD